MRARGNESSVGGVVYGGRPTPTINDRRDKLLKAFSQFDLNGDGVITLEEFIAIVTRPTTGRPPIPYEQAVKLFGEADLDKNGVVSLEEFAVRAAATEQQQRQDAQAAAAGYMDPRVRVVQEALEEEIFPQYHSLKVAFRQIDSDANGTISLDEFAEALQRLSPQIGVDLSPEQIQQLVAYYDQDGNGRIDYNEFKKALGHPIAFEGGGRPGSTRALGGDGAILAGLSEAQRAYASQTALQPVDGKHRAWPDTYEAPAPPPPPRPPPGIAAAGGRPRMAGGAMVDAGALKAVSNIEATLRNKLEEKFRTIHGAFRGADSDGSGHIDRGEFKRILSEVHHVNVSDGHMDLLLERFDTDGDGRVDFQEFSKWMMPGYFMVC